MCPVVDPVQGTGQVELTGESQVRRNFSPIERSYHDTSDPKKIKISDEKDVTDRLKNVVITLSSIHLVLDVYPVTCSLLRPSPLDFFICTPVVFRLVWSRDPG